MRNIDIEGYVTMFYIDSLITQGHKLKIAQFVIYVVCELIWRAIQIPLTIAYNSARAISIFFGACAYACDMLEHIRLDETQFTVENVVGVDSYLNVVVVFLALWYNAAQLEFAMRENLVDGHVLIDKIHSFFVGTLSENFVVVENLLE